MENKTDLHTHFCHLNYRLGYLIVYKVTLCWQYSNAHRVFKWMVNSITFYLFYNAIFTLNIFNFTSGEKWGEKICS